jgi:hypothetical protein
MQDMTCLFLINEIQSPVSFKSSNQDIINYYYICFALGVF